MTPKTLAYTLLLVIIPLTFIEASVAFVYGLPLQFVRYQMEFFRVILSKSDERIRKILLPIFIFDSHGLLHEIGYLGNLDKKKMLEGLNLQLLSSYVDETTFDWVNANKAPLTCLQNMNLSGSKYNATSLGNLAYIHLHSNHKEMRDKALELLTEIAQLENSSK